MPDPAGQNRRTPSDWKIEQLRLTCIFATPEPSLEGSLWERVVKSPPENIVLKPKLGLSQYQGPFASGRLTLTVQRERLDWMLAALDTQESDAVGLASLGQFPGAQEPFLELAKSALPLTPAIKRLAIGYVLDLPVQDPTDAALQLVPYLPALQIDAPRSTDLFYQINRPRPSKSVSGIVLNRLSKWSVLRVTTENITVGPGGVTLSTAREACYSRLELDMNTAAGHVVPQDKLSQVVDELVELASEIVAKGDIS